MQRSRLRARFEALAWVALVAFIGYRIWPQVAAAVGVDAASTAAPAFQLTTFDGRLVSASNSAAAWYW